ncbi:MAG: toll/interleukin-1 receptor domain-containing protein [Ilumatobacteraceae bacterium]
MTVFLSYAHQDVELATALRQDLEDIGYSVWLDESLHGGQIWWDEILRQLRECQAFVLAVSGHSLASEACVAEWAYAAALNRPFLPVRLDDTDWTTAPAAMRESQHIDYAVGDLQSMKALARSLMSVPDEVPLPDVLPLPPPAPQSYRERFAALFGSRALTIEEQVNYYVRLSLDVDGANSQEAIALLRVLHARPDLSWKVRLDIEKLIEGYGNGTVQTQTPGTGGGVAPTEPPTAPSRSRPKRLYWILGGAAAVAAIVVAAVLLWPKPGSDAGPPQPENSVCSIDTCSDKPIRFVDLVGTPDEIEVTLRDPFDHEVADVNAPTRRTGGGAALEWTWSADGEDPIGTYSVQFTSASAVTIQHTFTVEPSDGPFGVVQRAADAISRGDWKAAASIDGRIAKELAESGADLLEREYPVSDEKHWVPFDSSGQPNALSTAIIGVYITYRENIDQSIAYCEVWAVDPGNKTMTSGKLPVAGATQENSSVSGRKPLSYFSNFLSENCVQAGSPDAS